MARRSQVGVVGASGFGGTELLRLLHRHPHLEVAVRMASSRAGEPLRGLAPNIPPALEGDSLLEPVDPSRLADLDLVLLGTPDEVSLELAPPLVAAGTRVVDLSGAFRLSASDYGTWYGRTHAARALARGGATAATYGLTEHARDVVRAAVLVANPGCYPTATLLGLRPLIDLIHPDGIVVSAVSGTSGAGRSTRDGLQFSVAHGDVVASGAPSHRHTVEVETHLGARGEPSPIVFTPHLVPIARGLLATASARLLDGITQADVDDVLGCA